MTDQASLDQINAQIAAARAAAGAVAPGIAPGMAPAPYAGGPVPQVGMGYQPPAQVQGGRPVTLGEMLAQGGMRVDHYIKVDKAGFGIGNDTKNLQDELEVEFKLSDVVPFWGLRYGENPVKYAKSFDRILDSKSKKPWAQLVAEAQQIDSRCRGDYASADIPFTYVGDDITGTKGDNKDKVILSTGQTLGLTLSITNFKDFAAFVKPFEDLRAIGQLPHDVTLRGKLIHDQREGGGNTYGAATFVDFLVTAVHSEASAAETEQTPAE